MFHRCFDCFPHEIRQTIHGLVQHECFCGSYLICILTKTSEPARPFRLLQNLILNLNSE